MSAEQFLSLPIVIDRPSAITAAHVLKLAIIYVRQSSLDQVREHSGSTSAQRDLRNFALRWGWPESRVRVIDCDLGLSGTSTSSSPWCNSLRACVHRADPSEISQFRMFSPTKNDPSDFCHGLLGRGNSITYSCVPDTVDPRGPKGGR